MKPKMRTKEWLATARAVAGLTRQELADLAGLEWAQNVYAYELGKRNPSPETWAKIEKVLYAHAPIMYVDEDRMIAQVHDVVQEEGERSDFRMVFMPLGKGFVFTNISPVQGKEPSQPHITVSAKDALTLLEAQKALFAASEDSQLEK